jgi:hypothetical protein
MVTYIRRKKMNEMIKRVEDLLMMAERIPEKDDADVYIPAGNDAAIRCKVYKEVLRMMRGQRE